ncbi:hypothetical protein C8N35_1011378 [Breoghania corrubedonensis]|uniref:Uncharacterized protein n=1 Tax=Breoghania corrubedonensis TaxID=665038 RepID=A0A2T5VHT8_9HYPH|nr:hypothetical protein [Breoghania corrubedonensis]PTW63327.1 hypothetical protein C8N35_1011378 [Breoghania corrubedonensis]
MSQTVDRVTAPLPLVKAADHSTDHNPREQPHFEQQDDSAMHPQAEGSVREPVEDEEPAVVLDTGAHPATPLGGVAAYQATARHAIEALGRDPLLEGDEGHDADEEATPWRLSSDDS